MAAASVPDPPTANPPSIYSLGHFTYSLVIHSILLSLTWQKGAMYWTPNSACVRCTQTM